VSLPDIKEALNEYEFKWKAEQVTIQATLLKEHSDGRVTGDITITTQAKEYHPHIHQSQFNFSAGRTRETLAKTLHSRVPDLISLKQWEDIIEQLCVKIVAMIREGEPALELAIDDTKNIPPEYLLEPILLKGLPTIIYGEKGANKSTLSILFSICMLLPWKDNPLGLVCPTRSIKSLILDWEQDKEIVQYQAKCLKDGMNLPYFDVYYRHCARPLANDLPQIARNISKVGAEVIIIDSLGAACGGELNKPGPALDFFAALRELRIASIILAQTSKDTESKKKTVFGSTYFTYYARSVFELVKADEIDKTSSDIALFNREANYSARHDPIGFHLTYNGTGIMVQRQDVNIGQFIKRHSTQQAIYEVLKRGAMKPKEIAKETGENENAVRVALSRMKAAGKIVMTDQGYGLLSKDIMQ